MCVGDVNIYNNVYRYNIVRVITCLVHFCAFQGRKRYGRGLSGRRYGVPWIGAQVAKICWATLRSWWLQVCCTGRRSSAQTLAVRPDWSSPTSTPPPFSSSNPQSSRSAVRTGKLLLYVMTLLLRYIRF